MLVFAAIVPHARELLKQPKKAPATHAALSELSRAFAKAKPDVTIVLSPHAKTLDRAFTLNLAEAYTLELPGHGKRTFKGDSLSTIEIRKSRMTDGEAPVMLASEPKLDYGTAVPLSLVAGKRETLLMPIAPSSHALDAHAAFGRVIKEVIMASPKRFAIIASAELGRGKDAEAFDARVIEGFASDAAAQDLLVLSPREQKKSGACGLSAIAVLLGALKGLPWKYKQYAHERAFNKGLLVAEFTPLQER